MEDDIIDGDLIRKKRPRMKLRNKLVSEDKTTYVEEELFTEDELRSIRETRELLARVDDLLKEVQGGGDTYSP